MSLLLLLVIAGVLIVTGRRIVAPVLAARRQKLQALPDAERHAAADKVLREMEAESERLHRELAVTQRKALECEQRAMVAVQAGKDEAAKAALLQHNEWLSAANQYRAEIEMSDAAVVKYRALVARLAVMAEAERERVTP